jgi:hypothetical protein
MELKSLTRRIKCVGAESGCLSMLRECLGSCSMRLGAPFIAPRQLGAIGDQHGRLSLPSVEGAPDSPVRHRTTTVACLVHDFLPNRAQPTVAPRGRLAHRTVSGADRTVRCTQPTIGAATCRALIARTTVGVCAVGSPDSPVHHRQSGEL